MNSFDELRSLFDRMQSGSISDDDRLALERAALAGQISFSRGNRSVTIKGDAKESIIITGDRNLIIQGSNANIMSDALSKLFKSIETDRSEQALRDYFRALRMFSSQAPYLVFEEQLPSRRFQTIEEIYVPPRFVDAAAAPSMSEDELPATVSLEDVFRELDDQSAPILVLGEPGTGKSTLLRHITRHAWDAPAKIGLPRSHIAMVVPLRSLTSAKGMAEARLRGALENAAELVLQQDLPPGFLREWSDRMDAPWLFLLDGLDEVNQDERSSLMRWLRTTLGGSADMNRHRVLVTSRPISTFDIGRDFQVYTLQHFSDQDRATFARAWFDERSNEFVTHLSQTHVGGLSTTPLLLTIAAAVYELDGQLPDLPVKLYERFVSIYLSEAERRGLDEELGERVAKLKRSGLAALARFQIIEGGNTSTKWLGRKAAEYLRSALGLTPEEAAKDGKDFVEVMGRRSGIFITRGTRCEWLHRTFGDYLLAETLTDVVDAATPEAEQLVEHWREEPWREVVLFCLGIWSTEQQPVNPHVRAIWEAGTEGWAFAANAVADGARIDRGLRDAIELTLHGWARKGGLVDVVSLYPHLLPMVKSTPERDWDTRELESMVRGSRRQKSKFIYCWSVHCGWTNR